VVEHAVDGLEVFSALIVQAFCFGLEVGKAALRVDVDGVFGVLANVELGFYLLRRL
jgi:hypothetical protein